MKFEEEMIRMHFLWAMYVHAKLTYTSHHL
jgi:hypothetical protein